MLLLAVEIALIQVLDAEFNLPFYLAQILVVHNETLPDPASGLLSPGVSEGILVGVFT